MKKTKINVNNVIDECKERKETVVGLVGSVILTGRPRYMYRYGGLG